MPPPNLPSVDGEELSPLVGFWGSENNSSFQFVSKPFFKITSDTSSVRRTEGGQRLIFNLIHILIFPGFLKPQNSLLFVFV